jgi:manganese transport protein
VIVIAISGDQGSYKLLILSQVILSLQLPFAVIPLVHFTSDKLKMGSFANRLWVKILAWITSFLIIALNGKLVYDQVVEWATGGGSLWVSIPMIGGVAIISLFLIYIMIHPLLRGERSWEEERPSGALAVIEGIETRPSKNIAAALGRESSDAAIISRALSLAKAEGGMLTLIHVADSASSQVYDRDVYDEHTRDDEQYLIEVANEIHSAEVPVEIALVHGDPSKELVDFVESHDVDILVMGSHGHRLLGDLLWGETVDPVRHQLKIPVMVVR